MERRKFKLGTRSTTFFYFYLFISYHLTVNYVRRKHCKVDKNVVYLITPPPPTTTIIIIIITIITTTTRATITMITTTTTITVKKKSYPAVYHYIIQCYLN